ncbi:uncharacterized protein BO96DRAFT_410761 [Aspergillus niger CBS 101883]|uniref:uncharacterized protein n=1 Tax=Aspergillus lacticoffeatus (strain CBS 101883) TaxID=1450533 RepID=UPI000D7F92EE|nr:uncharacterized protein BO96DRAFT_410761 [Aspergillus niger CBS 101883]PYH58740.1 hypothetical protein BO96DRAFT_410761 [Aspergillus niger CBS 101883]
MDAIEDYYLPLGASFSPLDKEVPGVPEGFSKQDNHFPPHALLINHLPIQTNRMGQMPQGRYLAGYLEVSYRATVYLRSTE